MSRFLTYWSLSFAIFVIWIFSIAVALADVKDELIDKVNKQWVARGKARLRPTNPLAGQSVAETLPGSARTEAQEWVFGEVSRIAASLRLPVKIVVLQDSMDHFLVHFAQGPRLVTYRVDKAWVADARGGKTEQLERIRRAVEQYLRAEFLGEKPPATAAPGATAPPAAKPPDGGPGAPSGVPAAGASQAAPGAGTSAPSAAGPPAEMSREEKIAAAKAKAEAMKAQRESGNSPDGSRASPSGGGPAPD